MYSENEIKITIIPVVNDTHTCKTHLIPTSL